MSPLLYMWLFLKASLLSTGGSGNLPFLHKDLIALGWAKEPDFVTAMAVGQVSPGPTGLWSISLGYLTYGWLGAFMALVALSLPPLLVLVVDAFYNRLQNLVTVQNAMRGLTLGIIGLTLIAIAAGAMGLALSKRVPIILVLALAALAGWLLYGR
jgi:chromate transporter